MAYKFQHTIHGPAVVSDDEVVFFHQTVLLLDYAAEYSNFIEDAKKFVANQIKELSERASKSLYEAVVGSEEMHSLPQYVFAVDAIHRLNFELNNPPQ